MDDKTLQTTDNLPTIGSNYATLIDSFIASLDRPQGTKETYRKGLKQFFLWINDVAIIRPDRGSILAYKRYLEDKIASRSLSHNTLSNYITAVRKFFEWAEGMKFYPNIAKGIKGSKKAKGFLKDPLTIDQIKELLLQIDRTNLQGKRDFALLNLLVRTGLRTIEVVRADTGDIRQESGEALLYIQGKGRDNKDEFVLLTPDTLKPIYEYLKERKAGDNAAPLFASLSDRNKDQRLTTRTIRMIVKQHLRGIGLNSGRLTAHSFRHTAITLALLGGATVQEAQELARHTNINTTMIYAHNINRIVHAPERKIDSLLNIIN